MKRDLMDILACPTCKSALELRAETEEDGDIVAGSLRCEACEETYPIAGGIPNLLPADLRDAVAADSDGDEPS